MGSKGERTVPIEAFFIKPGKSILEQDEILTEIHIPNLPPRTEGVHLKHSTRRVDVAVAGVSVVMAFDGEKCQDIRIALGAVGPTPFRAKRAEDILRGQKLKGELESVITKVAQVASDESFPIDDQRGQADYRKELVKNIVKQGIANTIEQARS